jgi:type IV fimbrial biogenesis protein FimT
MPAPSQRQRGLTLIEMASLIGIVAVLVGFALPSFHAQTLRRQLEGTAAQLETDMQLARSEAVARQESVRLSFARGDHGSCYVVHNGPASACQCSGSGEVVCAPDAQALRSVHLAVTSAVQLKSNAASLLFDATKGTVTPTATVQVNVSIGSIRQVINVMGRVRSCSPDAAVAGYRRC